MAFKLFLLLSLIGPGLRLAHGDAGLETCPELYQATKARISDMLLSLKTSWECPDCWDVPTGCDVANLKSIPQVILIGERHDSEDSLDVQKAIFKLSSKAGLPVATEISNGAPAFSWSGKQKLFHGKYQQISSPNIIGIESPSIHGLLASYDIQAEIINHGMDRSALIFLTSHILINPVFRGAYEKMRTKGQYKNLMRTLDESLIAFKADGGRPASDMGKTLAALEKVGREFPPAILTQFFNGLHVELVDLVNSEFPEDIRDFEKEYLLSKSDSERLGMIIPMKFLPGSYMDQITLRPRDRIFSAKISDLLCRFSGKSPRLIAIVGDSHVDGIIKRLSLISKNKVRITYLRSFDPTEAREILDLVNKPK